jgi:hypothetical protein
MSTRGAAPQRGDGPVETSSGLHQPGQSRDPVPDARVNPQSQANLVSPSEPQDTYSVRAKNSRHGKVTADHWNQ